MSSDTKRFSVKKLKNGRWAVTYNGRQLLTNKTYENREDAIAEANRMEKAT